MWKDYIKKEFEKLKFLCNVIFYTGKKKNNQKCANTTNPSVYRGYILAGQP